MHAHRQNIVVCVPCRDSDTDLPPAHLSSGPSFISGGERSLYELATGAAVSGHTVELRGDINATILATLTESAGATPLLPTDRRRPKDGEIVVVPEAYDVERLSTLHLSGARVVVLALAPPGLFGWSFLARWSLPDHFTVPIDHVGQPESFQAISALGFSLWTNAHGIADAAQSAGTSVTWLGTGTPVPFPSPSTKLFDIAVVQSNRWRVWADHVANDLAEFSVVRIPARASTYSLCEDLAGARILLWPSRIEGMSRISREARAVGTVPVALDTNPFATKDDHGEGVVLVPDLTTLRSTARRLLKHPEELDELSRRAVAAAREQADWSRFVARVDGAIAAVPNRPDAAARSEFGALVSERVALLRSQVERFKGVEEAFQNAESAEIDAQGELHHTQEALRAARSELARFRSRRVVRLLDRLAALRRASTTPSRGDDSP